MIDAPTIDRGRTSDPRRRIQGTLPTIGPEAASKLPNVFVVGAAKSGTTALYNYFKVHPQIHVPQNVKEANYMAFPDGLPPLNGPGDRWVYTETVTNLADYLRLYGERDVDLSADVSHTYLYYPHAAHNIAQACPQAKIIMILRNPVECVLSMYSMMHRYQREPCEKLADAFLDSPRRAAAGWEWAWDYQNYFLYASQVARYLDLFPESQIFIRRYEELKHDPARFYSDLCSFLGISTIDLAAANRPVNLAPTRREMLRKRKLTRRLLRVAGAVALFCPPPLKSALRRRFLDCPAYVLRPEDRRMLVDHFGQDILDLGRLLSWDVSAWLAV
jgi:hypothetical protein